MPAAHLLPSLPFLLLGCAQTKPANLTDSEVVEPVVLTVDAPLHDFAVAVYAAGFDTPPDLSFTVQGTIAATTDATLTMWWLDVPWTADVVIGDDASAWQAEDIPAGTQDAAEFRFRDDEGPALGEPVSMVLELTGDAVFEGAITVTSKATAKDPQTAELDVELLN